VLTRNADENVSTQQYLPLHLLQKQRILINNNFQNKSFCARKKINNFDFKIDLQQSLSKHLQRFASSEATDLQTTR